MRKRRNKEQIAWCENYRHATGFEPLMDDFKTGEKSFREAAEHSVDWFESLMVEAMRSIDRYPESDEDGDAK